MRIADIALFGMCFTDKQATLFMDDEERQNVCIGTLFKQQFGFAHAAEFCFQLTLVTFNRKALFNFFVDGLHQLFNGLRDIFGDHPAHNGVKRIDHLVFVVRDLLGHNRRDDALQCLLKSIGVLCCAL